MDTLVEKLSNCHDYFSWLSGFPDFSGKVLATTFKFSSFDYSTMLRKSNANKTVYFFSVLLKCREIVMVKTVTHKKFYYFKFKLLKFRKKKPELTSFYYVSRQIGWTIQKSLFAYTIKDSTFSHTCENSKMYNITSKYFNFCNNKPPASLVVHITRYFLRYSYSYHISML